MLIALLVVIAFTGTLLACPFIIALRTVFS